MKLKRKFCRHPFGLRLFNWVNRNKPRFTCPVCKYTGSLIKYQTNTGPRKHALCPKCGAVERQRIQYLVFQKVTGDASLDEMAMLHCTPEPCFEGRFRKVFKKYTTMDLSLNNVDVNADLTDLPFEDDSYDVVFASHILTYIRDDRKALSEIHRVLKKDGIAIIPMPIYGEETIEYPEPNIDEGLGHLRAPGLDYFDRYREVFPLVEVFDSNSFPAEFQTFIYEDRVNWPGSMSMRQISEGEKHVEYVPVCFKNEESIRKHDDEGSARRVA